jgi:hypothetical protein
MTSQPTSGEESETPSHVGTGTHVCASLQKAVFNREKYNFANS